MEDLTTVSRSCYCGAPRAADIGTTIVIKGWVHRRRDHGGLIFVDLRDRTGLCQVVFSPESLSENEFERAGTLRNEYVLAVKGEIARRPEGTVNSKIPTGEIEIITKSFTILNTSEPPPFALDEYANVSEDTRLRYRFLDLRRPEMQSVLFTRARMYKSVRDYLSGQGFIEVETPMLTRSTPEGARDFIVPSRLSPG